ncbi:MAG TPA: phosphate uptake regulator PhoU [Thermoprotei archaeon]|nr:phosphate uptake regulator PhoU [Thermoprotei archaeon]
MYHCIYHILSPLLGYQIRRQLQWKIELTYHSPVPYQSIHLITFEKLYRLGFNYKEDYITYIEYGDYMGEVIHRKIQRTGGTTYIVSLPKKWVEKHNLKEGDFIILVIDEDEITIKTEEERREELSAVIDVKDIDPRLMERLVISYYLAGYDIVKVVDKKISEEYRSHIKKIIKKKMIGFEVIDEDIDIIKVGSLVKEKELSLDIAVSRMFKIGRFLLEILPDVILEHNESNARLIIQTDDDMDRLYLYIIRMVRKTRDRSFDVGRLIITSMLAKALERIVDHIVKIAYTVIEISKPIEKNIRKMLYNILHISSEIYVSTYNAYIHKDIILANEVISRVKNTSRKFDYITNKLREDEKLSSEEIIHINTILESGKRICEYSADICEMIIDLNISNISTTSLF